MFRLLALTLDRNKEILILQKTIKQYPTSFCETVKGMMKIMMKIISFVPRTGPHFHGNSQLKKEKDMKVCEPRWGQEGKFYTWNTHMHVRKHARVIIDTTSVTKDKQWPIRLQPWNWSFQLHTRAGLDKLPGFMHNLPCMCPLCDLILWKHKEWTATRISNHSNQIQEQFKVQMCYLYQVANFHKNLETKKQRVG